MPIIENSLLGEYALSEEINGAIRLISQARKSGLTLKDYLLTPDMFEGNARDRYDEFEILLATAMTEGVENFRQVLDLYNETARNEVGNVDEGNLFGKVTKQDVKDLILDYYARQRNQQEQGQQQHQGQETRDADGGIQESDDASGRAIDLNERLIDSDTTEPQPISENRWGKIYQWTLGKAKEAAAFLKKQGSGYLKGVFHREGIGDIDVM